MTCLGVIDEFERVAAPDIPRRAISTFRSGPSTDLFFQTYRATKELRSLCWDLGMERPATEREAQELLTRRTEALLRWLKPPAAVATVPWGDGTACPHALLTVAVLSRSSRRIFFRHRRPAFDEARLCRSLNFVAGELCGPEQYGLLRAPGAWR